MQPFTGNDDVSISQRDEKPLANSFIFVIISCCFVHVMSQSKIRPCPLIACLRVLSIYVVSPANSATLNHLPVTCFPLAATVAMLAILVLPVKWKAPPMCCVVNTLNVGPFAKHQPCNNKPVLLFIIFLIQLYESCDGHDLLINQSNM